jgi:hypothetical protein
MFDLNPMEILNIACTPHGEDCAQVGSSGYAAIARKECRALRSQLIRIHGEPPAGCIIVVKSFPHDFGSYYEVCAKYDPDDDTATEYVYKLENETPEYWDDEAKEELNLSCPACDYLEKKDKIPVVSVPMTLDSTVDVECPRCGESRCVEPDANYLITCDCGKKYQLRSEI